MVGCPNPWLASAAVARLLLALRPWLALAFTPVGFRTVVGLRVGSTSTTYGEEQAPLLRQRLYPAPVTDYCITIML